VKDFDASFFETLSAPKNMSAAAAERMQKAVVKVLQQPELKQKLLQADMEVVANASTEALQRLRADQQKWGRVAAKIQLQLD
jgi:tripartite-type tricarboxylate transporter receptor subunit TctC